MICYFYLQARVAMQQQIAECDIAKALCFDEQDRVKLNATIYHWIGSLGQFDNNVRNALKIVVSRTFGCQVPFFGHSVWKCRYILCNRVWSFTICNQRRACHTLSTCWTDWTLGAYPIVFSFLKLIFEVTSTWQCSVPVWIALHIPILTIGMAHLHVMNCFSLFRWKRIRQS